MIRAIGMAMSCAGWIAASAHLPAAAGTPPEARCEAAKEKAAGKYAQCLAAVRSKEVRSGAARDASSCVDRLESAFARAEAKAAGSCPTAADSVATTALVDGCVDDITTAILDGIAPPGLGGDAARCDSRKAKAAGRYIACLMRARAKATGWGVFVDPTDTDKCESKLTEWIDESNAGDPIEPCSVVGDAPSILASANACPLDFSGSTAQTKSFAMLCNLGIATIPIPMDLTVTPTELFEAGVAQPTDAQLRVEISESLVGTLISLGAIVIQLDSASSITTAAGASGGVLANTVDGTPFFIDLSIDTDVPPDGVPGPLVILTDVATANLTPEVGATSVEFELTSVSVSLSMVPVLGTLNLACTQNPTAANEPISFVVIP